MKLKIGKPLKQSVPPKNTFRITIETMEGDADDEHLIIIDEKTEEDVLFRYKQWQELCLQDTDCYNKLWFFEDSIWQDEIHYNCDSGHYDSLGDFEITWFNEDGIEHSVKLLKGKK